MTVDRVLQGGKSSSKAEKRRLPAKKEISKERMSTPHVAEEFKITMGLHGSLAHVQSVAKIQEGVRGVPEKGDPLSRRLIPRKDMRCAAQRQFLLF